MARFAALAVALTVAATASGVGATQPRVVALRSGIERVRSQTWRWQDVAFRPRTPTSRAELRTRGVPYLRWIARRWNRRRVAASWTAHHPPHLADWLCIQSGIKGGRWNDRLRYLGGGTRVGWGEGAWTLIDGPYFGGMQMDLDFQRTYGTRLLAAKGTADHWTPWEQMYVAEQAVPSRGFQPWPTTARSCGLL